MQTMFLTAASAPFGSGPWRFVRRPWSVCRSPSLSTSNPTATWLTPLSFETACVTAFWKCDRTGHPGVVSDTTMFTRPPSAGSIERTMPRSTMLWRSSGSMTTLSASRICSCVGVGISTHSGKGLELDRPKLLQHAEAVEHAPVLQERAVVVEADDVDRLPGDVPAGRRDAEHLALLRALVADAEAHLVSARDRVEDGRPQVGEPVPQALDDLLQPGTAEVEARSTRVFLVLRADDLVDGVEVPSAEALLHHAPERRDLRLVRHLDGEPTSGRAHRKAPTAPRRAPPAEGGEILHYRPGYVGGR